jgi:hypothetical protein
VELGTAWSNAKFNVYAEMAAALGTGYGKNMDKIDFALQTEKWWFTLYESRLDITGLIPWKVLDVPRVEFTDEEQLTMFILRWS